MTINQQGKEAVTSYAGEEITITNSQAALLNGTLTTGSKDLSAITDYNVTYVTANPLPPSASFLVKFPLEIKIQDSVTCSLIIPSSSSKVPATVAALPCIADVDTVVIRGGQLPITIPAGTKITLRMSSIMNPDTQGLISTLTLASFTDETLQYAVDQILKGLVT